MLVFLFYLTTGLMTAFSVYVINKRKITMTQFIYCLLLWPIIAVITLPELTADIKVDEK